MQATVPCAGTTPGPLGAPLSYTVPPNDLDQAGDNYAGSTGDANGYLAFHWGRYGGDGIAIVRGDGAVMSTFTEPILEWILPQPKGFFADPNDPGSSNDVTRVNEDGTMSASQMTANGVAVGNDPAGGLLAVFYSSSRQATLSSFDTSGSERWSYSVPGGPYSLAVVGADVLGDTLLLLSTGTGSQGSALPTQGQWFDTNGVPGPTFAVTPGLVIAGYQQLYPQVAGGLLLYSGGTCTNTFASGANASSAPPSWLAGRGPMHLVFGGQAYATVSPPGPAAGSCDAPVVSVFSSAGQTCGSVSLPPSYDCAVDVGLDGTLIELKPENANCTGCNPDTGSCYCAPAWQFWPGYLK